MTKQEVMALLKANKNQRGIDNWIKMGAQTRGLKSHGIGLTQLRKLARKVGRDRKLARQLWDSNVYDAKVIGLLIDEPKMITREQAERQVEQLEAGMLVHIFASCDATLAKADFIPELAPDWVASQDDVRRRCGFLLLYELSKNQRNKALEDAYFLPYLEQIEHSIHDQGYRVAQCMQAAIIGIGKRNKRLNKVAIKTVKAIGPVAGDPEDHCPPTDVLKHLTSDYLKEKFSRLVAGVVGPA